MSTKTVAVNNSTYPKLDTGTETAWLIQNVGPEPVLVVMSASLPAPSATPFFIVKPGDWVPRNGMTGDFYAMVSSSVVTSSNMTVGE